MEQIFSWFLAQVKPQSYKIAERNLRRQGFETFLPQIDLTGEQSGRFVTRSKPLFPGYIFVAFDLHSSAPRKINATLGVSRLVGVAGRPAAVPQSIIDGLHARCDDGGMLSDDLSVRAGDDVRLLTGPFADFVARVERIDPSKRVWVLIELMGRQTTVALDDTSWRVA